MEILVLSFWEAQTVTGLNSLLDLNLLHSNPFQVVLHCHVILSIDENIEFVLMFEIVTLSIFK